MSMFFTSLWNEAEVLAQTCKGHYCPKDNVKDELRHLVLKHVCSKKQCKHVEQTDWLDVLRAHKPGCLE